jgi:hypothetical protein
VRLYPHQLITPPATNLNEAATKKKRREYSLRERERMHVAFMAIE